MRAAGFAYEGIGRPISATDVLPTTAERERELAAVVEAIILCGGKAERLGDAAGGRPKSLVDVGGQPLVALPGRPARARGRRARDHLVRRSARASCSSSELAGLGPEVVAAEEPERLGRGGGIKFAARERQEDGDVYALNGDELVEVDFEALLERHRETGAAATVAVARPKSPFGVVDLGEDDVVEGFQEAGRIPYWVNCGIYVFSDEAVERLPGPRRPRDDDVPGARRRAAPARVPPRGPVADGEHAEGAAHRAEHLAAHPEWLRA